MAILHRQWISISDALLAVNSENTPGDGNSLPLTTWFSNFHAFMSCLSLGVQCEPLCSNVQPFTGHFEGTNGNSWKHGNLGHSNEEGHGLFF